jgi:MFS superfamily sulfate permease-like transporter
MYKLGWEQFVPFIITIVAIQFSDLLKGISLGMLVAIFYILRTNYRRDYKFHQDPKVDGGLITITLSEHVTFINKGSIANKLTHVENDSHVIIEGKNAHFIDLDVLEILYDFKENAKQKNIQVEFKNIPERIKVSGH